MLLSLESQRVDITWVNDKNNKMLMKVIREDLKKGEKNYVQGLEVLKSQDVSFSSE